MKLLGKLSVLALLVTTFTCKKEFDSPPVNEIPAGSIITISELRDMYQGTDVRFNSDVNIFATVTADERSGNLYKNVYIQDETGAINMSLIYSGGLYQGDLLRINLNGSKLTADNDQLVIDSVDTDHQVVKQSTMNEVTPIELSVSDIRDSFESYLVKINDAQFIESELGMTFADADNKQSANRYLEDCTGRQVLVRTSGYANFAGQPLPEGKGSVIGVLGNYRGTMQLYIRDYDEVNLSGERCPNYLRKNFEDESVTSGGWSTQVVTGTTNWFAAEFDDNWFGKISNFSGGSNTASEAWLISPIVDLSSATAPVFSFDNAYNYNGDPLKVYISADYDGFSNPNSASWTELNPVLSTGNWDFVSSGQLDISSFAGYSNVYVAFKYTGSNSDGSTWEIDNILIEEQ